jgi:hypothetical protein
MIAWWKRWREKRRRSKKAKQKARWRKEEAYRMEQRRRWWAGEPPLMAILGLALLSNLAVADAWQDKYMLMLQGRMVKAVEYWAIGFVITKPPRTQAHLLDEDIKWGNTASTDEERALCVALALYKARARAQKELRDMIVLTETQRATSTNLRMFLDMAPDEIAKWRKKSKGITDAEVKRLNFSY